MVEDNPNVGELQCMMEFIRENDKNYLYLCDKEDLKVVKYFDMAEIKIDGLVAEEGKLIEKNVGRLPVLMVDNLEKHENKSNIGIIITCIEKQEEIINLLSNTGINQYYVMSAWNKRTISYKMSPRSRENFWLEVNLADHCNLNCQCCDHFSPLAPKTFLDFAQYEKDIKRLAELTDGHIGILKLQGGEPLLNDKLIDYIKVSRQYFPETLICIFTDGLLLKKWGEKEGEDNIWKAVKDYEVEIRMTEYPINLDKAGIKKQCESWGIPFVTEPPEFKKGARCWCFSEIGALNYRGVKKSVRHPFDLSGDVEKYRWISCYQFNESIVLRDGKIYTCPMIPYVHYFNDYFDKDLEVTEDDYIDIYEVSTFEEIAEFCTHRVPFCSYCAVHKRHSMDWKQSKHIVDEYVLSDKFDNSCAVKELMQKLMGTKKELYIYAAGNEGTQLYFDLRENGICIQAFVDKNYEKIKRCCIKEVISPAEFFDIYRRNKNKIGVVIGSQAYRNEIYDTLISNNIKADDIY